MTWQFRTGTNAVASSSTDDSVTINVPAGTANGNLLVCVLVFQTAGEPAPTFTGWTLDANVNGIGADLSAYAYYRIASSEPASYTPTWTNERCAAAMMCAYEDGGGAITRDTSVATLYSSANTHTNNEATAASANSLIVSIHCGDEGTTNADYTSPTLTERAKVLGQTGTPGAIITADAQPAAGATGAKTATYDRSDTGAGGIIIFKVPAAATGAKTLAALGVG